MTKSFTHINLITLRVTRMSALALLSAAPLASQATPPFPPIPAVHGTLDLRVAWPVAGSTLSVGDSTFLFGSLGNGDATLKIGGRSVPVAPNGAWLAWVPIPRDSAFGLAITATLGDESKTIILPLGRTNWVREERAWVDRASIAPIGALWVPTNEMVTLSVRAAPGARVRLRLPDGRTVPFTSVRAMPQLPPGVREFDRDPRNLIRAARADEWVAILPMTSPGEVPSDWLTSKTAASVAVGRLEVILGSDTTRIPWPLSVHRVNNRPMVRLDDGPDGGPWRPVVGRPFAGRGTYTWFFPRGTMAHAEARSNGDVRLRLSDGNVAWVPIEAAQSFGVAEDVRPVPISSLTLSPGATSTTLRIPMVRPIPFNIDEEERRLTITLHDAIGVIDWTRYGAENAFVKAVTWHQDAVDRVRITVDFDRPIWGWRTRVDGSDLLVEFRQPPIIDATAPLRGRRIVVDAGHPPLGACGPTGWCEPEANLAVAQRLTDALRAAGADVTMTRVGMESVPLRARSALADSLDAELFIAIHNNAFPDGINPFTNSGSSTFYNHLPSLSLARAAQHELVASLGTRDLGIARGDLSVVRPTWYPAILTEGLFLMIPEHEAALRTPEVQQRYATAVLRGVEAFLRQTSAAAGK